MFSGLAESVFTITTFDGERILEKGQAFLLTANTLVAPFSLFKEANRAEITPLNGGNTIEITNFFAYDRINNIILLETKNPGAVPLKLYGASKTEGIKTIILSKKRGNIQPLGTGTCLQEQVVQGRKLFSISNQIVRTATGAPVFVSNGSVLGMAISEELAYQRRYFAVPALEFIEMVNNRGEAKPIAQIGKANSQRNASVKHIILKTDFGDITIKLYNETPAYRDNFIQLAEEGFYDNLMFHRIIRDFGIQTGAADTRHARHDDVVGWKGPGYTIPAHVVEGLFHKRGAIGSPRKPDDRNQNRRSDGSQFYIVTGRKYSDEELDELEAEHNISYTPGQREVYKTIGGAPHIDQSYTVFGEVISGLEVADRMSLLPVKGDFRPLQDIRLKSVEVIY
jgi:cyclophilin family peptidyl-prolyl cis-trans isomerase